MIRFIPDSAMMESILRDSSLMDPYQYIQNVLHLRQDCTCTLLFNQDFRTHGRYMEQNEYYGYGHIIQFMFME